MSASEHSALDRFYCIHNFQVLSNYDYIRSINNRCEKLKLLLKSLPTYFLQTKLDELDLKFNVEANAPFPKPQKRRQMP